MWTLNTNGTWVIYINGALNNTYTSRLYPTVGDRNTNTWGTGFDNALIDEFQQYNRVLTLAEVQLIYAGTITYNSGSNPTIVATDSKFGTKSLYFPGTTYTGAVGLTPITLTDPSAVTISAWVKFATLDSTPRTILSMVNATDSIKLAATATNYQITRGTNTYNVPIAPTTGTWTHLVASTEKGTANADLYRLRINKQESYLNQTAVVSPAFSTYTKSAVGSSTNADVVSSGSSLFVVVGNGATNTIATSTDAITWTTRGKTIFTAQGYGVVYANNLWVAFGEGTNTIATSTDGINWTGRGSTVFTTSGRGGAYANGLWVAVGQGTNTIATSTDGINWTGRGASVFTDYGRAVTYKNNLWVAVGSGGHTVASSTDGINWTGRGSIINSHADGVEYANGLWVICGYTNTNSNTLATSTDGINWTGRGMIFSIVGYAVKYINNLWIAVGWGATNTVYTSVDGISWTGRGIVLGEGWTIDYNNNLYVITGYNLGSGNIIATSPDLTTWTQRSSTFFSYAMGLASLYIPSTDTSISYINTDKMDGYIDDLRVYNTLLSGVQISQLFDGRSDPSTLVSYYTFDSESLNTSGNSFANYASGAPVYDAVLGNPELFTISGERFGTGCLSFPSTSYSGNVQLGPVSLVDTSNITISTWVKNTQFNSTPQTIISLGNTTTQSSISLSMTNMTYSLTCNTKQKIYVAGGYGDKNVATSIDGINWTSRKIIVLSELYGVAYANGILVAVGFGTVNSIATSTDGITWTGRGITFFTGSGRGVAYGNGLWVAVGLGTNSIATSPDGITWTGRTLKTIFSNLGYSVAFGNGLWVAVGSGSTNTIATSPDGINWTGRAGTSLFLYGGFKVDYGNGLWVAVGRTGNTIEILSITGIAIIISPVLC